MKKQESIKTRRDANGDPRKAKMKKESKKGIKYKEEQAVVIEAKVNRHTEEKGRIC